MRDGSQGRHGDKSKRVVVRLVMEVSTVDKGQQMDEGQGRGRRPEQRWKAGPKGGCWDRESYSEWKMKVITGDRDQYQTWGGGHLRDGGCSR